MNSIILSCKCPHEGQDRIHGKQRRVFTRTSKDVGGKPVWRCAVCETEKTTEVKENG